MNIALEYKKYLLSLRSFWVLWLLGEVLSYYALFQFIDFAKSDPSTAQPPGQFLITFSKLGLNLLILFSLRAGMEKPVSFGDYILFLLRYLGFLLIIGVILIVLILLGGIAVAIGMSAGWIPKFESGPEGYLGIVKILVDIMLVLGLVTTPVFVWFFSAQFARLKVLPGWGNMKAALGDGEYKKALTLVSIAILGVFFIGYYGLDLKSFWDLAAKPSEQVVKMRELYVNREIPLYIMEIVNSLFVILYGYVTYVFVKNVKGFEPPAETEGE